MGSKVGYPLNFKNGAAVFLPPSPVEDLANLQEPDIYAQSSVQLYPLGTLAWFPGMGKKYRYSRAGGALTGTKNLAINANRVPDGGTGYDNVDGFYGHCQVDGVAVAYDAGAEELSITDTINKAKNFYEGAHLIHFDAARNVAYEESYIISGPAKAIVTPWQNTIVKLHKPKKYAIVASDGIEIWCNPYRKIMMATSSGYETYMGVAPIPITSGYYFWLQTAGPVFITPNGWSTLCPGYTTNSRVVMAISGIITTQAAQGAGHQVIGTLLATTVTTKADAYLNMNLDLGH